MKKMKLMNMMMMKLMKKTMKNLMKKIFVFVEIIAIVHLTDVLNQSFDFDPQTKMIFE